MGEKQNQPFQLLFNAALMIDFRGSRVTSDGGLMLMRKEDRRPVGQARPALLAATDGEPSYAPVVWKPGACQRP